MKLKINKKIISLFFSIITITIILVFVGFIISVKAKELPVTELEPTIFLREATIFLHAESANLLLVDVEGNITGLKDGVFIEEIPNVELIFPIGGVFPDEEPPRWQPAFYISYDIDLTFIIEGGDRDEEFSIVKFGVGYFVDFSSFIKKGGESKINVSANGTRVSIFDHEKEYKLVLNKNRNGISETFSTVGIPITDSAVHQYIIDWDALYQDEKGITIKIDAEGNGIFEEIQSFYLAKIAEAENLTYLIRRLPIDLPVEYPPVEEPVPIEPEPKIRLGTIIGIVVGVIIIILIYLFLKKKKSF